MMASSASVYRRKARQIAKQVGHAEGVDLDPDIFEAQIGQESGFNPNANSGKAIGIAQFTPATAASRGVNPRDPISSLKGAAKLDAEYLKAYGGDWKKVLTAYNAGPGRVGKPLFPETQNYISRILSGKNPTAARATGSGGTSTEGAGQWSVQLGQKTTTDQAGFEGAQRKQLLANFLTQTGKGHSVLFRSGLLSTAAPSMADFTQTSLTSKLVKDDDTTASGAGQVGGTAGDFLKRAVAQSRTKQPYQWGGGHGASPAKIGTPVDCSGYVSQILGVSPRVSGQFAKFGDAGPGRQVTIYANSGHVLLQIGSRWFATSHQNPGGGAGEIAPPSKAYLSRFTARHPKGL